MLVGGIGQYILCLTKVKCLKFVFKSFSLCQLEGLSSWSLHLKAEAHCVGAGVSPLRCHGWYGQPLVGRRQRWLAGGAWDLLGRDVVQFWLLSHLLISAGMWGCWPKLPIVPPSSVEVMNPFDWFRCMDGLVLLMCSGAGRSSLLARLQVSRTCKGVLSARYQSCKQSAPLSMGGCSANSSTLGCCSNLQYRALTANYCRPCVGLTSPCWCASWLVWLARPKHRHVSPNFLDPRGPAPFPASHKKPPGCSFTSSWCTMTLRAASLSSCHHKPIFLSGRRWGLGRPKAWLPQTSSWAAHGPGWRSATANPPWPNLNLSSFPSQKTVHFCKPCCVLFSYDSQLFIQVSAAYIQM